MACGNDIHYNDIGTVFEVTLKDCGNVVDLASMSSGQIIFQKPDGTKVTKTAALKTDGTDGVIQYITVDQDLDQTGNWKLQAVVALPLGKWSSEIIKFKVLSNL